MFFHHPQAKEALRSMARKALHGSSMQPTDLRIWSRLKVVSQFIGWELVIAWLTLLFTGFRSGSNAFHDAAWRDFFLAGLVMFSVIFLNRRLVSLLSSSPTTMVLYHLPVSGRDICRWVRRGILWRALLVLPRLLVIAYAWHGFPSLTHAWPRILLSGLLLWLSVAASLMLRHQRMQGRIQASHLWNLVLVVWAVLFAYLMWVEKSVSLATSLPAWILAICNSLVWLLPAQWAMHAFESTPGALLTLACLVLGGLRWLRFPDETGVNFDTLFPGSPFADDLPLGNGGPEDDEALSDEEPIPASSETTLSVAPASSDAVMDIKAVLADEALGHSSGWVEAMVFALMSPRDRMLCRALTGPNPGWTRSWGKAARICLGLLTLLAVLKLGTAWITQDSLEPWCWVLPMAAALGFTFPASNSLPVALLAHPAGQLSMPLFAGLPVRVADLLRISNRITLGRLAACLVLVLPTLAVQCLILGLTHVIPGLWMAVLVCAAAWLTWRPVLIYYRLQQMTRPARGALLGHFAVYLLIFPLAAAMGFISFFCMIVAIPFAFGQGDGCWLPPLVVVVLAGCGRLIYAIFHARVRARKVDWLT